MTTVALSHDRGLAALPFDLEDAGTVQRFTAAVRKALELLGWGPVCRGRSVLIKPNPFLFVTHRSICAGAIQDFAELKRTGCFTVFMSPIRHNALQ